MKLHLVRFGKISHISHKSFFHENTFHSPPKKKGIYCFLYGYIEDFLWVWKVKEDCDSPEFKKKYRKIRKDIYYEGPVWTHFLDIARKMGVIEEEANTWCKVDSRYIPTIFKKALHRELVRAKMLNNMLLYNHEGFLTKKCVAYDDFELFIERIK